MRSSGTRFGPPESLAGLIHAIHAAGLESGHWPDALERLRRHLDARVVTVGRHEFSTGSGSTLFEAAGEGDIDFSRAMAGYSTRNPCFLSSQAFVPGRVMTGDELVGHDQLQRTDFYRGLLQPRSLLHLLCGVIDARPRGTHFLFAWRAADQPRFCERDKAALEALLGHVTLSLEGQWRWQEADDLSRALLSLAEHDSTATLLVDADGQCVYRNRAADRLLAAGHGLRLADARLVAANAGDRRLLNDAIERLARSARDADGAGTAPVVLTLAATPPVIAVLRAAGSVYAREAGERRALVMVAIRGGADATHDPASCVFARRYQLTAAQAKVCALVYGGRSLATIADTLNVSENTVRSHLKQIFQKTGTHGQMELVHLHARMCQP